jgi:hypothetical protein
MKSSGSSLYECSTSYSKITLKCSFASRILTTTSGGVYSDGQLISNSQIS